MSEHPILKLDEGEGGLEPGASVSLVCSARLQRWATEAAEAAEPPVGARQEVKVSEGAAEGLRGQGLAVVPHASPLFLPPSLSILLLVSPFLQCGNLNPRPLF